jgi:hypothetical protein
MKCVGLEPRYPGIAVTSDVELGSPIYTGFPKLPSVYNEDMVPGLASDLHRHLTLLAQSATRIRDIPHTSLLVFVLPLQRGPASLHTNECPPPIGST